MMAAISSSKPRREADDTPVRQRILDAAFSAFMESGFAETSTLEIATRARVSKRELYALVGSKQEMLMACIGERAKRLQVPTDLPELHDRESLARVLATFGTQLLREVSDPTVIAVFRLAIAEAVRAPEVAQALSSIAVETSRAAADAARERDARARRRLRRGFVATTLALVAALVAGTVAFVQRHDANEQRQNANEQASAADVARLVSLSQSLTGTKRDMRFLRTSV